MVYYEGGIFIFYEKWYIALVWAGIIVVNIGIIITIVGNIG